MTSLSNQKSAGFFRRLGALLYDTLIIIAIEMIAVGIVIATMEALVYLGIMDYGHYIDASDLLSHHPIWRWVFHFYIVLVWYGGKERGLCFLTLCEFPGTPGTHMYV